MDRHRLAELRGRLKVVEIGFKVQMFNAWHVREIVVDLLDEYPDMPDEEHERVEDLRLAATEPRGRVL